MCKQALANQHDTVRYLVEKCNFPVDLCAGGSRITPLMAVITRKCGSPGGFEKAGVVLHTEACGITNKRQDESEYLDQPYCVPLFPMTQVTSMATSHNLSCLVLLSSIQLASQM